ncbi:MAG: type II toxin-antitoxin system PemK/MazF family toxin [Coriobacteriales bacterium]|jgi:mRNA interferase MazF|nr:type II toxin-antitoxin system PemK/MazF family toxin [Coriobacteriales bacterium]
MSEHKDYREWMLVKAGINNESDRPVGFKEREIWLCNIGENVGYENDGKGGRFTRPVLIVKAFNRQTCFVVPLSTTPKRTVYHFVFDGNTGKESVALLSQPRTVDASRLNRKIGMVSEQDFKVIKRCLGEALGLIQFTPAQGGGDIPKD